MDNWANIVFGEVQAERFQALGRTEILRVVLARLTNLNAIMADAMQVATGRKLPSERFLKIAQSGFCVACGHSELIHELGTEMKCLEDNCGCIGYVTLNNYQIRTDGWRVEYRDKVVAFLTQAGELKAAQLVADYVEPA